VLPVEQVLVEKVMEEEPKQLLQPHQAKLYIYMLEVLALAP
jgi:hypothetical protein